MTKLYSMIILLVMLIGCLHAAALMKDKKSNNDNNKVAKRNADESNEDNGEPTWDNELILSNLLQKRLEKRFPKWRSSAISNSKTNNNQNDDWDPEDPFKNAGSYNHESRKAWQRNMDEKRKLYRKMYG